MGELESGWWSPFFEDRWDLDADAIGDEPPREVRRYYPPISGTSRLWQAAMVALMLAPIAWWVSRAMEGGETGVPIVATIVACSVGAAILVLPRVINPARGPAYDVQRQLEMAEKGELAYGVVQRVDYARQRTRAGYRDGTAIDTSRGNAHCRFERPDGVATEVLVPFDRKQPALKDGDRVALLYDPIHAEDCMAVLHLTDVELREPGR